MNYRVIFTKGAEKDYNKFEKKIQEQIKGSLRELRDFIAGEADKMPDVKKLKGKYNGLYRLRSGNYRIIYEAKNRIRVILMIKIMH
ncbi:MAG: mRNA interferase RelE/StbE [Thermotogaceae bacterium]|nr:mRNA interferase RelE/StbE [Thermotogaceae bacterium]